jgi:hypothetical protein
MRFASKTFRRKLAKKSRSRRSRRSRQTRRIQRGGDNGIPYTGIPKGAVITNPLFVDRVTYNPEV